MSALSRVGVAVRQVVEGVDKSAGTSTMLAVSSGSVVSIASLPLFSILNHNFLYNLGSLTQFILKAICLQTVIMLISPLSSKSPPLTLILQEKDTASDYFITLSITEIYTTYTTII